MALKEMTLYGEVDKVKRSIDRLKEFEPEEGYFLAYSGGKDSDTLLHLAIQAGVKFDAHYNLTTVDPPELVYHVRDKKKEIKALGYDLYIDRPSESMWRLIPRKLMPPTRIVRYCCDVLKEQAGKYRIVLTGVRWAESTARSNRDVIEIIASRKKDKIKLNSDNDEHRRMFENCIKKGKRVVNPIIDWEDSDVWEYLKSNNISYCKLYDQGYKRLGCIGCPMNTRAEKELESYPKFKAAYIRAFDRMIQERKKRGLPTQWENGEEVMDWWLHGTVKEKPLEGQDDLFDELD